MAQAETIRGPVDGESLGKLLAHKHLLTLGTEVRQDYPSYLDNPRRYLTGARA